MYCSSHLRNLYARHVALVGDGNEFRCTNAWHYSTTSLTSFMLIGYKYVMDDTYHSDMTPLSIFFNKETVTHFIIVESLRFLFVFYAYLLLYILFGSWYRVYGFLWKVNIFSWVLRPEPHVFPVEELALIHIGQPAITQWSAFAWCSHVLIIHTLLLGKI
jgi:hypothetical protein